VFRLQTLDQSKFDTVSHTFAYTLYAQDSALTHFLICRVPVASVNRNGIQLNLEGDVSALFFRKNTTHNVLTANGVIRVNVCVYCFI
jgi:hypothetical protein